MSMAEWVQRTCCCHEPGAVDCLRARTIVNGRPLDPDERCECYCHDLVDPYYPDEDEY